MITLKLISEVFFIKLNIELQMDIIVEKNKQVSVPSLKKISG
jgi:hypothetical protein